MKFKITFEFEGNEEDLNDMVSEFGTKYDNFDWEQIE